MMRPTLCCAAILLALGGCDSGEPARNVTKIRVVSQQQERLKQLPEPMRNLALMRAVRDSGNRCRRVDASVEQGVHLDMPMWVARCEDGRDWAIFMAPNDDIQVRNCAQAEQLGLPQCTPPQPAATPAQ